MLQSKLSFRQYLIFLISLGIIFNSFRNFKFTLLWLALVLLVAAFQAFPLRLPQKDVISLSETFLLAAVFIFPLATAITALIASSLVVYYLQRAKILVAGISLITVSRQIVVLAASYWLFERLHNFGFTNSAWLSILNVTFVSLVFFLFSLALAQWDLSERQGSPFWPTFFGSLSLNGVVYFCETATVILIVLMYKPLKFYSFFLFSTPLLAVHYTFSNFLKIKETYRNTLRALSRTIQIEDPLQEGHSERVMDLAIDIGREMGLYGESLEKLGYAALLHDIGKLGLDVNSFDYLLDSEKITEEVVPHAQIGYETLKQVKFLEPYANIIRYHHVPYVYRRNLDVVLPLESRIIAVADYFDLLVNSPLLEKRMSLRQALNKVKKDSFMFDPKVIRALVAVVRRKKDWLFIKKFKKG